MEQVAYENVWKTLTGIPKVSLAGKRYTFVSEDTDGGLVTAPAGGYILGITNEPNGVGEPTQIHATGELFIKLGGTVAPGQAMQVGPNGTGIVNNASTVVGICRVGGNAGDIGTIFIK
ncbi:hypothetical protein D3C76_1219790 [compost metagenome]